MIQRDITNVMNAGTITATEMDEIIIHASKTVSATFKSMERRYNFDGYDKVIHQLFRCLLQPYLIFDEKLNSNERQLKRIHNQLSIHNRVNIWELLIVLKKMVKYVYMEYDESDAKKAMFWIRNSIEQLYQSCCEFKDGRMYSTNMYL